MKESFSEKELWEKFTFEGFLVISAFALALLLIFAICGMQLFMTLVGALSETYSVWKSLGLIYLTIWILCFLFMCLIPKLTQRRELRRKQQLRKLIKGEIKENEPKEEKNKKFQKRYKK